MIRPFIRLVTLVACIGSFMQVSASKQIDSLIQELQLVEDSHEEAILLSTLSIVYRFTDPDSARAYAEKLSHVAADSDNPNIRVEEAETWFSYYSAQANYEKASEWAQKGVKLTYQAEDWERWMDFKHNVGYIMLKNDQYTDLVKYAQRNVFLADSVDYLGGQGKAYMLLANARLYSGNTKLAQEAAQKAFEIFNELGDRSSLATIHQLIGNIYFFQGTYELALESYIKAADLFELLKDTRSLSGTYLNMGSVHHSIGDLQQAESYYLKSRQLTKDLNDLSAEINASLSLGNLWLTSDPIKARRYYQAAAEAARDADEPDGLARSYNNIANTHYYTNDFEQALEYYQRALAVQQRIENLQEVTLLRINMGYCYSKLGRLAQAVESLQQGMELARKINNRDEVGKAYEALADIYEEAGKYKEALDYRNRLISYNDSLRKLEVAERIAELQTLYDTEKKEREIESLTQQREIDELRIREQELLLSKQRTRLVFLIAFFFLFLLMMYGTYKRLKLRKQRELQDAVIQEQQSGLRAVIRATEDERKRIAKDLHDGIAQTLSGLRLSLDKLWREIDFSDTIQQKRFRQAVDYLDEACEEVRTISHEMMPRALQKAGLIPAIQDMLANSLQHTAFEYTFEFFGLNEHDRFDESVEISLFRILQELVNNVVRHSGAKNLNIQLLRNETHLVMMVEDDGKGFEYSEEDQQAGIGLMNVKSRVSFVNGDVRYEPGPKRGTVATIRIPVSDDKD